MLNFKTLYLAFAVMAATIATAPAATVDGLTVARIAVADQGQAEHQRALREALLQVVVKLSGDSGVVTSPPIRQALGQPLRYVSQFGYEVHPGGDGQDLRVEFDGASLEALLVNNGLPLWSPERPTTVMWLALEDHAGRQLIGSDSDPQWQALLAALTQQRGLPYVLPLLDLEDSALISAAEVWGEFRDAIEQASRRYAVETILVGRMSQVASAWRGHWMLIGEDGRSDSWDSEAADQAGALAGGINGLADRLGRQYARRIEAGRQNEITIAVNNISGIEDYARALTYLQSLYQVTHVSVREIQAARASFSVQYKGSIDDVRAAIERGKVLTADTSSQLGFNYETLGYSLLP